MEFSHHQHLWPNSNIGIGLVLTLLLALVKLGKKESQSTLKVYLKNYFRCLLLRHFPLTEEAEQRLNVDNQA